MPTCYSQQAARIRLSSSIKYLANLGVRMKLVVSPVIDRSFRFVEMVGVTALLTFFVRPWGLNAQSAVIFVGSALSLIYLLEPLILRLVNLVQHKDRIQRFLMRLMVVLMMALLIRLLMVFVAFVAIVLSLKVFR